MVREPVIVNLRASRPMQQPSNHKRRMRRCGPLTIYLSIICDDSLEEYGVTRKADRRRSDALAREGVTTHILSLRSAAQLRMALIFLFALAGYALYAFIASRDKRQYILNHWRQEVSYAMCAALMLPSLYTAVIRWIAMVRVYGTMFPRAWFRFAIISIRTVKQSDWYIAFMLISSALMPLIPRIVADCPGLLILGAGTTLLAIGDRVFPPCILLLGASQAATIRLEMLTTWYAAPLPVASFLLTSPAESMPIAHQVKFLSLRARRSDEWREIVRSLINICPVVVLDIRVLTESVQEELSWMLLPERSFKLIVFGRQSSPRSLAPKRYSKPNAVAAIVREDEYCAFLGYVRNSRSSIPSRTSPVAAALRAFRARPA